MMNNSWMNVEPFREWAVQSSAAIIYDLEIPAAILTPGLQDFTGLYFACKLRWPTEPFRAAIEALQGYAKHLEHDFNEPELILRVLFCYCVEMLRHEGIFMLGEK